MLFILYYWVISCYDRHLAVYYSYKQVPVSMVTYSLDNPQNFICTNIYIGGDLQFSNTYPPVNWMFILMLALFFHVVQYLHTTFYTWS